MNYQLHKIIKGVSFFLSNCWGISTTFNYDLLINGLKESKQTNIVILSGAGISVAAGIPDFRTPKIGLQDNLAKYNLPQPEAIFDITFYSKNPKPFHQFVLDTFTRKKRPTKAHFFISLLSKRRQLLMNFTQNIDGLEHAAGLEKDKLIECHGNFRTAKCISCGNPGSIDLFISKIKNGDNYICDCKSLIKPSIVFFGEMLPSEFQENIRLLWRADLGFIIGSSMKVYPFANLVNSFNENCPIVILNKEHLDIDVPNPSLFLQGDIEQTIEGIIRKCGFEKKIANLIK